MSLASWIIDFTVYFVQNIYSLVTQGDALCKTSHNLHVVYLFSIITKKFVTILVSEKSHIVLLYNSTSRTAFKNLLSLVKKFKENVNLLAASSPHISNIQEMNGTLQYLFDSWPLELESLELFIKDAGIITDKVTDKWMKGNKNSSLT